MVKSPSNIITDTQITEGLMHEAFFSKMALGLLVKCLHCTSLDVLVFRREVSLPSHCECKNKICMPQRK